MRILYFSTKYTVHDRRFLSKLADSEHEVLFLPLEGYNSAGANPPPLPPGVKLTSMPCRGAIDPQAADLIGMMSDFEAVLNRVQPDLAHAGPIQSCAFMTALSGFHPFVAMSWGSDMLVEADRDASSLWITNFTLRNADKLVCDCDAVRLKARDLVGYPDDRIVQFPWGVDLAPFIPSGTGPTFREEQGWENCFVILSTRSWEPIYGIDVLLKAFAKAYCEKRNLRLALLGAGSLAGDIDRFLNQASLNDVVFRPGVVSSEALQTYYREADLFLSCSHSDGTSVSLLEAMASGLPVVVTDIPGNREWVTPGVHGGLARDGDHEDFAESILRAERLTDEERSRIAQTNRQVCEQRADWHANFPRLLEAYSALDSRSRHA